MSRRAAKAAKEREAVRHVPGEHRVRVTGRHPVRGVAPGEEGVVHATLEEVDRWAARGSIEILDRKESKPETVHERKPVARTKTAAPADTLTAVDSAFVTKEAGPTPEHE